MRRTQLIGACLTAVLATIAVPSASASSPPEPEFLTKVVVPPSSHIPVTGTIGANYVESVAGNKVECKSGSLTGEVTGAQSVAEIKVVLKKCVAPAFPGSTCETAGQPLETIVSLTLAGTLNNVAPTVPGLKLFNQSSKGSTVTEFDCVLPGTGTIHNVLKGSWIGELTTAVGQDEKTGKLQPSLTTWFNVSGPGVQQFEEFTEGSEQFLNAHLEDSAAFNPFEQAAQKAKVVLKTVPASWGLGVTK